MAIDIQFIFDRTTPITESGCWLWDGYCDKDSYGRIYLAGTQKCAHRVAYELVHGKIPEGMLVCHKCDVPSCVNPYHLFLGSPKDNVDDMHEKGRASPHCKRKLSDDDIDDIRITYETCDITQYELAELYDVGQDPISRIINHKRRI